MKKSPWKFSQSLITKPENQESTVIVGGDDKNDYLSRIIISYSICSS